MTEIGLTYLGHPDAAWDLDPEARARALACHLVRSGWRPAVGEQKTGNEVIDSFLAGL